MSRLLALTLAFCLTLVVASAGEQPAAEIDIEDAAQPLIDGIRDMAQDAKRGNYMTKLREDVHQLQGAAKELLSRIPDKGPECEASLIIKTAAARTGSHEVLTALLAADPMEVLDGRLSLALAFLEEVAHVMEDELALDGDVAPHLAAVMFGTGVTLDVIDSADEFVKPALEEEEKAAEEASKGKEKDHPKDTGKEKVRARRQGLNLGGGWSVGGNGLQWQSKSGNFRANAMYNPFTGSASAGFTFRW